MHRRRDIDQSSWQAAHVSMPRAEKNFGDDKLFRSCAGETVRGGGGEILFVRHLACTGRL